MSTDRSEDSFEDEIDCRLSRLRRHSSSPRAAGETPLLLDIDFESLRRNLGLTQQDAAVLLGVSRVTYIKYETDPDSMPTGVYKKLIRELTRLADLRESA